MPNYVFRIQQQTGLPFGDQFGFSACGLDISCMGLGLAAWLGTWMMIVHTCNISWLEIRLCSHLCWTLILGYHAEFKPCGASGQP